MASDTVAYRGGIAWQVFKKNAIILDFNYLILYQIEKIQIRESDVF